MKLISVIIPVYNAENHLNKSINSVLNQTYNDIEVILINDGSSDNSGIICDKYAKNDNRVKVIHQRNSGVSASRNRGISIARGDYITFVDADDYIEKNMLAKLSAVINEEVQLVICGYRYIYINNYVDKYPKEDEYTKKEFLINFGELYKGNFINSTCNKLYLKEIIQENNINFNRDINMGEDLLFNLKYLDFCEIIYVIEDVLYNYIKSDNGSLTSKFHKNLFENQKMLFNKVKEFLLSYNYYTQTNKKIVLTNYTNNIVGCIGNLFHSDSNLIRDKKKDMIKKIINDESVRDNILYFEKGNVQKRIIGFLIKNNMNNGIYCYFKLKHLLKNKANFLFKLLKQFNKFSLKGS